MANIGTKSMSSGVNYSDLTLFLWPMAIGLLVGVLTVALAGHAPQWLEYLPQRTATIVSGMDGIARSSEHPSEAILIMGYQWLFLPWYAAVWFIKFGPWKKAIRMTTAAKAATLRPGQRVLALIGELYLAAYALGDFGVIPVPTMINARWAYPWDAAVFFLRPIYHSNVLLMLYAWVSPVCESVVWWLLINFTLNILLYLGLHRSNL